MRYSGHCLSGWAYVGYPYVPWEGIGHVVVGACMHSPLLYSAPCQRMSPVKDSIHRSSSESAASGASNAICTTIAPSAQTAAAADARSSLRTRAMRHLGALSSQLSMGSFPVRSLHNRHAHLRRTRCHPQSTCLLQKITTERRRRS